MSKKAKLLYIILLISLFLTGYQFSKRLRERREHPTSQAYSQSVDQPSLSSFCFTDAA